MVVTDYPVRIEYNVTDYATGLKEAYHKWRAGAKNIIR